MRCDPNAYEISLWRQKKPRHSRVTLMVWFGMPILLGLLSFVLFVNGLMLYGFALDAFGVRVQAQIFAKTQGLNQKHKDIFFLNSRFKFKDQSYLSKNEVTEADYHWAQKGEWLPLRVLPFWPNEMPRLERYTEFEKNENILLAAFIVDVLALAITVTIKSDNKRERHLVAYGELVEATITSKKEDSNARKENVVCSFEFNGKRFDQLLGIYSDAMRRKKIGGNLWLVFLPESPEKAVVWQSLSFRPAKPSKRRTTRSVGNSSEGA